MSYEFRGEERFAAPPEKLFAALTDFNVLARVIPDLVESHREGDALICTVKPGFSFLRAKLTVTLNIVHQQPPVSADMQANVKGIGVQMSLESGLRVSPDESGSKLDWQAKITQMKGLLAAVSGNLVKASADQVIRDAWAKLRSELGET